MKALTVQQPWAWAIIHGGKDVENRTQAWRYRGPLAIHAGQRTSDRGLRTVPSIIEAEEQPGVLAAWQRAELTTGAIIGTVQLVDVHRASTNLGDLEPCCASWWAEREYVEHGGRVRRQLTHLVLEDPRPLPEPIPCRGALGLWTVPPEVGL